MKWKGTFFNGCFSVTPTYGGPNWWIRFWTTFFFGVKWTRA